VPAGKMLLKWEVTAEYQLRAPFFFLPLAHLPVPFVRPLRSMQQVGKQSWLSMPGQNLYLVAMFSCCHCNGLKTEAHDGRKPGHRKSRPFDAPGQTQENVVVVVTVS